MGILRRGGLLVLRCTGRNSKRPSDRSTLIRFVGGTILNQDQGPPSTVGAEIHSLRVPAFSRRWSLDGSPPFVVVFSSTPSERCSIHSFFYSRAGAPVKSLVSFFLSRVRIARLSFALVVFAANRYTPASCFSGRDCATPSVCHPRLRGRGAGGKREETCAATPKTMRNAECRVRNERQNWFSFCTRHSAFRIDRLLPRGLRRFLGRSHQPRFQIQGRVQAGPRSPVGDPQ